ncbi:MAG: hypothetical protein RLZZ385_1557 [Pseudomonadota bacterium]|jgi:ribosomal protein L11 methyltransferase
MPWQQLQLRLRGEDAESLEQLLLDQGASAVTLLDAEDQPIFQTEPGAQPLWDETIVSALFSMTAPLDDIIRQVLNQVPAGMVSHYHVERLEDQDWRTAWMADFHPMQFGDRLWICPSWLSPPDPQAVNILLDPGLAFGTGTHPTTALCLSWLDRTNVTDMLVVDYGCGSGVLGIGAALLGAARVVAVDNDPQAVTATATNRDHNRIDPQRLSCHLPDDMPDLQADALLANILAQPLHDLATRFADLLKPGAHVVLSGLIENQVDDLLDTYARDFHMDPPVIQDGWVRLSGRRKPTR